MRFILQGAGSGAFASFAFTALHYLVISDIWFSFPIMLIAGAVTGACVAWSYHRLFPTISLRTWIGYNTLYVALLVLLGIASILVFEPITTVGEVLAGGQPSSELFMRSMPLSVAFTVLGTGLVVWRNARGWLDALSVLITMSILVWLLGMNVSLLGLVYIPNSDLYLVGEFFALIVFLNAAFVLGVVALARGSFRRGQQLEDAPSRERSTEMAAK